MTFIPEEAYARIKELYDKTPKSNCIGQCSFTCGPVFFSRTEWEIIPETLREGKRRPGWEESRLGLLARENEYHSGQPVVSPACQFLVNNRCSIYEYRPFVCRSWGCVDDPMNRCPAGCAPSLKHDDWMPDAERYFEIYIMDGSVQDVSE